MALHVLSDTAIHRRKKLHTLPPIKRTSSMLHLAQRNRQSCTFSELAVFLGRRLKCGHWDFLAHGDTELLVERPGMFDRLLDEVVGHELTPSTLPR